MHSDSTREQRSLLVTGASGFLGRNFLECLDRSHWDQIQALVRTPGSLANAGVDEIQGDLLHPEDWLQQVAEGATVLHMAALTGKGSRRQHLEQGEGAMRALLDVCHRRHCRRFLFVSSVAVSFDNRPGYHYAEAKEAAEALLLSSGIDALILRPTMIFGPGSPVQEAMEKLATMPLVPLFAGGKSRVAPVAAKDLARLLDALLRSDDFDSRILAVVGPDDISLREMLAKMRKIKTGKEGGMMPLPLAPTRLLLRLMEPLFLKIMPLTAGQLATFANDSLAVEGMSVGAEFMVTDLGAMLESEDA